MERRQYLVGCVGVTAGLAGCGNLSDGSDDSQAADEDDDDDEDRGSQTPSQVQTVREFYRLLDRGEVAEANRLIHPDGAEQEVSTEERETFRDELEFDVKETELLTDGQEESEVRMILEIASRESGESQTSELVVVLRQHEGQWKIYGSRSYDPEETTEDEDEEGDDHQNHRLQVVSAVGTDTDEDNQLEEVAITVKKAMGADDIDLGAVAVQWVTDEEVLDLTMDDNRTDGVFTVDAIQDDDASISDSAIVNSPEDRATIQITVENSTIAPLDESQSVTVKLLARSGGETTVTLNVPDSLEGKRAVAL